MITSASPFFGLWTDLTKSSGDRFDVVLSKDAQRHLRKLGPEFQQRAQKVLGRVHGASMADPNPHLSRMNDNQHKQVGLDPKLGVGYTLGDYRVRMMGQLQGDKLTVFYAGTREDSKHTGRSAR